MVVIVHKRDGKLEKWEGITEIVRYPGMSSITLCRAPSATKADHTDEERHWVDGVRLEVI